MQSKLKEFAKDSMLYGIGDFASKAAALIVVPILSRVFVPSEYGVIDLLNVTYLFIIATVDLGVATGLQKFYYQTVGLARRILVSSSVAGIVAIATLLGGILASLSGWISEAAFGTREYHVAVFLTAIRLPVDALLQVLLLMLRLQRRAVSFSIYSVAMVILLPLLTIICVVTLELGLSGVFVARLIASSAVVLVLALHQRKQFASKLSLAQFSDLVKFSLPGVPGNIVRDAMSVLPKYILGFFAGLSSVGVFGMAEKVGKVVDMVKNAFNRAWNPFAFANAGAADEKLLYEKVFRALALLLLFITLLFGIFAEQILWILAPPEYFGAIPLVIGLCFYYTLRSLVLILATGLYTSNKVAHTSYVEVIQLGVFLILAVLFVPRYGAVGMVISLDLSALVLLGSYGYAIKRQFRFSLSVSRIGMAVAVASFLYFFARVVSDKSGSLLLVLFADLFSLVAFGVFGYHEVLRPDERRVAMQKIREILAELLKRAH